MFLLVGLGNPGPEHTNTRHNIGFMVLDALADANGFTPWRQRFQGHLCKGRIERTSALALKPTTYMNLSGQSVSEVMRYFKITTKELIVVHDDVDLELGTVRCKQGGSSAGHRGIDSVDAHVGRDFTRIRIGVGHPGRNRMTSYVLNNFSDSERPQIDELIKIITKYFSLITSNNGSLFSKQIANALAALGLPSNPDNTSKSVK